MIFDTGSNWVWVNSRLCANCNPIMARFDERKSDTFSFYNVLFDLHYGSGDVYGYNAHDSICALPDKCANDFSFLTAAMQLGLSSVRSSGIVGLSPNHFEKRGDLFIEKLAQSGVIDERVFSMYIDVKGDTSKMTLGGYDMDTYAYPGSKLSFHSIDSESPHWEIHMDKMTVPGLYPG